MIKIVKYTQIHKAIVNKLKSKFSTIDVTSQDVSEGFKRPSFFIEFDNVKSSDFMNESLDRDITVRIYYFSKDKDKNKVELLNIQDELNELFLKDKIITIDEFTKVEVDEIDLNTIDKVLHCYFDIRLSEDYDRTDNTPNMEELEINI